MLKRKILCSNLVLSEQAILINLIFFMLLKTKCDFQKKFSDLALNQILKCQNFKWISSEVQPIPWCKTRRKPT